MDIELTIESTEYILDKTTDVYDKDLRRECIYKVTAPPMSTIKMKLLEMHLSVCAPDIVDMNYQILYHQQIQQCT